MAAEYSMTQAIVQAEIEAVKALIIAVREADNLFNSAIPLHTMPKSGSPAVREPKFE